MIGAMRKLLLSIGLIFACGANAADDDVIRVGSKSFTENFILGEIIAQIAEETGEATVDRKLGLGDIAIINAALVAGEIDRYPEYSGTHETDSLAVNASESVSCVH